MHPELAISLADQHRRELQAQAALARAAAHAPRRGPGRVTARRTPLPRYRITWTRASLALAHGGDTHRSLVIVISTSRSR
jgi:hypothetical protein